MERKVAGLIFSSGTNAILCLTPLIALRCVKSPNHLPFFTINICYQSKPSQGRFDNRKSCPNIFSYFSFQKDANTVEEDQQRGCKDGEGTSDEGGSDYKE